MQGRKIFLGLVGLSLFLLIWHLVTLGNGRTDVPGPWLTLAGLIELATGGVLWRYIIASVFRVMWGFTLAVLVGVPVGLAIGWSRWFRELVNPLVQGLRPISPIAWLPIAVLVFGGMTWWEPSDLSAIFLIFLASIFPIITAATSAVEGIDVKFLRVATNLEVSGAKVLFQVILPAAMPQILTGLRLALGIAWVVLVAAEMLGVQSGLGFQINDSRNNLRYDLVVAAMVVISVIGMFLDGVMARIENSALSRRGTAKR
ncbi:ABC transporter permease [Rhodopirellula sallentina]|uniref:Binding-protein-dependent transport system inner membrane component n=1 Tax=Rhodopirellula sallentina SM41 TaxID=1263870 RepID=M5U4Q7_9BACT|nr:ABC transporter permease [Rhodopirellula sallentina]EMI56234.1 binding-protein-dependent transport system inner membrane component [Rhodopirellula sallentina SM41]